MSVRKFYNHLEPLQSILSIAERDKDKRQKTTEIPLDTTLQQTNCLCEANYLKTSFILQITAKQKL